MKITINQLHINTPDNLQGKILAWEAEWEASKNHNNVNKKFRAAQPQSSSGETTS